jgi:hypothetical protein
MRVFPLGYPVDICTTDAHVLRAVCQSWGTFPALFAEPPLIFEAETHNRQDQRGAIEFSVSDAELNFRAGEHNFAWFAPDCRFGRIVVSRGTAANLKQFRRDFLEPLVLTALDSVFFTPIHAAFVARGDRGVLLCGDSGAGKSSLAFACSRRGWTFLSDDSVHLAPGPQRIGVGGSWTIHLREPARGLFEHLDRFPTEVAANGKRSIVIDAAACGFQTQRQAVAARCIFLDRRPGCARLTPYSPRDAVEYALKYIRRWATPRSKEHLRQFFSQPPQRLSYDTCEEAVDLLDRLVC